MKLFLGLFLALPAALASSGPIIDRVQTANTVPSEYIAILHDDAQLESVVRDFQQNKHVKVNHQFSIGTYKGFAFTGDTTLLDELESSDNNDIKRVDTVKKCYLDAPYRELGHRTPVERALEHRSLIHQNNVTYNLARISHRQKGAPDYVYDDSAGQGVTIFILDSGVYTTHEEFEHRGKIGPNFSTDDYNYDSSGHGTHVAGIAAGKTYGVAKKASIVSVKVTGNNGIAVTSDIIAAISYVVNEAKTPLTIINLSLGGNYDQSFNDACAAAVNAGVFVSVSAGNHNTDARGRSPASEPTVCTVGATDANDKKDQYSNYGKAVDIYAPGRSVKSSWIGAPDATNILSGTSMAAPHIAGLAAYLLALEGEKTPPELCARIQQLSTKNVITGFPEGDQNSLNYLAFNGANDKSAA